MTKKNRKLSVAIYVDLLRLFRQDENQNHHMVDNFNVPSRIFWDNWENFVQLKLNFE